MSRNRLLLGVGQLVAVGALAACSSSAPTTTPTSQAAVPTTVIIEDPEDLVAQQYSLWFSSNSEPMQEASSAMSDSLLAITKTDLNPQFCQDLYEVWGDNYGIGQSSTVFDWISSAQQNPDPLMGQAMVDMSENYLSVLDACIKGDRESVVQAGDRYDASVKTVVERNQHWMDRDSN